MIDLYNNIIENPQLIKWIRIALIIVIGWLLVKITSALFKKYLGKNLTPQVKMLINKTIVYIGFFIILLTVLGEFNIKLSAILGGVGLVGIVIGIASQSSIGNIISGIFVISEKPFEIGDVIRVGDKMGVVHSIDLLSIKLRTFDNLLIRIPNQNIINTEVTNVTRFPYRRQDFEISVAYKEDLKKVKEILLDIAEKNPLVLNDPEPLFIYKNFGDSGINMLLGLWFEKSNYIKVKNSVFISIKEEFDKAGIEIPFPHISLYKGENSEPFPIRLVNDSGLKE